MPVTTLLATVHGHAGMCACCGSAQPLPSSHRNGCRKHCEDRSVHLLSCFSPLWHTLGMHSGMPLTPSLQLAPCLHWLSGWQLRCIRHPNMFWFLSTVSGILLMFCACSLFMQLSCESHLCYSAVSLLNQLPWRACRVPTIWKFPTSTMVSKGLMNSGKGLASNWGTNYTTHFRCIHQYTYTSADPSHHPAARPDPQMKGGSVAPGR